MSEEVVVIPEALHCVVCPNTLPPGRATSRSKFTCSKACRDAWKAYLKAQREGKKCPICLGPSTPEERKLFKAWRKSRGELRAGPGKPPVEDPLYGRRSDYREALMQAIMLLVEGEDRIVKHGFDWPKAVEARERFQNLVDGKGWVRRTLPESGDAEAPLKGDNDGISGGQAMGTGSGVGGNGEPDPDEHRGDADGAAAGDAGIDELDRDAGAERERSSEPADVRLSSRYES